jgi:hypothetical protein
LKRIDLILSTVDQRERCCDLATVDGLAWLMARNDTAAQILKWEKEAE